MKKKAKVIAYYLPQYHPIKENNEWWGNGFTEWTNVARAKPLFKGHEQPNIPADLGFYDLRMPEVRKQQAELAKDAGVDAFCYWHYWFGNGKQLLEKPLQEVVRLGEPDFPFCLGWANHHWRKKQWNKDVSRLDQTIIMEQTYPGEDDVINHFHTMLPMFKDSRYYKIKDKNVFLIYSVKEIPYLEMFINKWRELARQNNLPDFYFIGHVNNVEEIKYARKFDFNHLVYENHFKVFESDNIWFNRLHTLFASITGIPINKISYSRFIKRLDYSVVEQSNDIFPTIYSNWDTSPRLGAAARIITNPSPKYFNKLIKDVINILKEKPEEEKVIFLKSWNEWAEGNYVEPDLRYGNERLIALHDAIIDDKIEKDNSTLE